MPIQFGVSKTDILRGKTVQPGWYTAVIKTVVEKAAKTDGSTNVVVSFVVVGSNYDGVPIDVSFSEKAPGFRTPLMAALLGRPVKPEGENVDLEMGIGKKIQVYIKNDTYQGRLINKIEDYKPI